LLEGEKVTPRGAQSQSVKHSYFNKSMKTAVEGSLTNFFDNHEMELSALSALLATPAAVSKVENVLQLLYFGANVRCTSKQGLTPLLIAAITGNSDTITALLNAGSELEFRSISGATALYRASEGGTFSVLETLLAAGADVNAKNNYGYTPLLIAVRCNTAKHVTALLEARSDINTKTNDGSVFDLAKLNKNKIEVLPVLEQYKKRATRLNSNSHMRMWYNTITKKTVSREFLLTPSGETLLF